MSSMPVLWTTMYANCGGTSTAGTLPLDRGRRRAAAAVPITGYAFESETPSTWSTTVSTTAFTSCGSTVLAGTGDLTAATGAPLPRALP